MEGDALFVAVEGVDRAGKTTLVAALANTWRARGLAAATRAEPSRGPIGQLFRELGSDPALSAMAAALLSAADRRHQQPALAADLAGHDLVAADRYYLSGLAYHHAEGVDPDVYRALNAGPRWARPRR
jgi:dTMP kinase